MASPSWSTRFPFTSLEHLAAAKSDHSPILLSTELETRNVRHNLKKPFGYECMWETNTNFRGVVEDVWQTVVLAVSVSDLARKLESIARSLT